jgi:putative transposase
VAAEGSKPEHHGVDAGSSRLLSAIIARKSSLQKGPAKAHRSSRGIKRVSDVAFSLVRQAFQFKLFGSKRLRHLHGAIDVAAEIWNHAVALHRRYYRLFKKALPKARLQAHLARLRNGRCPDWKAVGSQSVQAITDRLYLAWEAFFAGDIKRPPTFRKRRKYRSFTLKQAGYKILGHGRIKILGRNYRFNQSRPLSGVIKTVTVRRDALREFLHNIFV